MSWAGSLDGFDDLMRELASSGFATSCAEDGPLPSGSADAVLEAVTDELGSAKLPEFGLGERSGLKRIAEVLFRHGLDLTHPAVVAHLQPPTLAVAAVADALGSVVNASVDTFDSGPSAVAIERWVIGVLANLARLGPAADGVMTPGGSMSNLLGLLLARDRAAAERGIDARRQGVSAIGNPVVLCSRTTHFSVDRACATLGLGEDAVIPIETDLYHRIDPRALRAKLDSLADDVVPIAIVATAGTTDFGTIDPLPELAAIARERRIWLHVDAAYGFGALFSDRLAPRLIGVELADSITLDLHKLGWQPAAASVLLVSDTQAFSALERHVDYLNPRDDAEAGYTGLLGRSLQTTRRADALKVAATFLSFGRAGLGALVDRCHELARHAQALILSNPELELIAPAEMTTVVFRYCPSISTSGTSLTTADIDKINASLRRRLLEAGQAVIGRTTVDDPSGLSRVCLKFTLMNPQTRPSDLSSLLERVVEAGRQCATTGEENA